MPIEKSDLLQGTLDMLILKIVELGRCTATGFRSESGRFPRKCCKCNRGHSTPLCIVWKSADGWRPSGANPTTAGSQVYKLSAKGRKQLATEESNWHRLAGAVGHILQTAE